MTYQLPNNLNTKLNLVKLNNSNYEHFNGFSLLEKTCNISDE